MASEKRPPLFRWRKPRPGGEAPQGSVWLVLRQVAGRIFRTGYFHLVLSIAGVQGLVYLAQFVIARLIGPADFGIVRSVEAILGIAVIVGSSGMPSLIVKFVAQQPSRQLQGSVLRRCATIACTAGLVSSLLFAVIGSAFIPAAARSYLWLLGFAVCITSTSRTVLNYFQGIKEFRLVSKVNLALSFVSLALTIFLVSRHGLSGWVISRYLGETAFLLGGLFLVRQVINSKASLPPELDCSLVVPMGMGISFSLLLRSVLDNMGVFVLGYLGEPPLAVGFFGLGTLIAAGAGLLPGAATSIFTPRLAEALQASPDDARALYLRVVRTQALATPALSLAIGLGTPLLPHLLGQQYAAAPGIVGILLLCVPFRAVVSVAGSYLVVLDRAAYTLYANGCILALAAVSLPPAVSSYGMYGAAWTTVALDAASAALYCSISLTCRERIPLPKTL